ncbi:MAG: hypothetical protein H6818_05475 [Phycisphaerales bacterium]|nr:hypothetical protein [Phycisphaerales bacterium]
MTAAICLALSLVLGAMSDGAYHDDDLTHFMMARWCRWYPGYLVNVWGRPGFTAPVALVAWIGDRATAWHVARGLSAIVTLGGALAATLLAKRLGLLCWRWTVLMCFAQPLNTVLSYTTLTENFTAMYLVAGLLLLQRRNAIAASMVFSLAFVSRLETVILLPIWWLCLVLQTPMRENRKRLAAAMACAIWAPIAHNVFHWMAYGNWPSQAFLRPGGSTEYLPTGPLAYLPPMLLAVSPIVFAIVIPGAILLVRRRRYGVVLVASAYLLTHCLITWFGIFASGGFARFAVAVAPLLAILAVAGCEALVNSMREMKGPTYVGAVLVGVIAFCWLAFVVEMRAGRLPWRYGWLEAGPFAWVLLVALMLVSVVVAKSPKIGRIVLGLVLIVVACGSIAQWATLVRPLRLGHDQELVRRVAESLDSERPVFCANPWIAWFDNHVEDPSAHKGRRLLSSMPVGTIFVWDSIYSASDFHQLPFERYRDDSAYRLVRSFGCGEHEACFRVFEKVRETPIEAGGRPYPLPLTMGRGERLGSYYERE